MTNDSKLFTKPIGRGTFIVGGLAALATAIIGCGKPGDDDESPSGPPSGKPTDDDPDPGHDDPLPAGAFNKLDSWYDAGLGCELVSDSPNNGMYFLIPDLNHSLNEIVAGANGANGTGRFSLDLVAFTNEYAKMGAIEAGVSYGNDLLGNPITNVRQAVQNALYTNIATGLGIPVTDPNHVTTSAEDQEIRSKIDDLVRTLGDGVGMESNNERDSVYAVECLRIRDDSNNLLSFLVMPVIDKQNSMKYIAVFWQNGQTLNGVQQRGIDTLYNAVEASQNVGF